MESNKKSFGHIDSKFQIRVGETNRFDLWYTPHKDLAAFHIGIFSKSQLLELGKTLESFAIFHDEK